MIEESSQCRRLRLIIHYLNTTTFFFLLHFHSKASAGLPPFSCARSSVRYPFCNRQLPIGRRVDDLISRLTLAEKISQLVDVTPAIPRLGIPRYDWWSEALHGVASNGKGMHFDAGPIKSATSFPQVIHSAATFRRDIWFRIGQAVSTEARAMYNSGQATGLTFWAPNINIFRDPRWGRGMETPGEDPLTVGEYAAAFVTGFQGHAPEHHLKASACCKHFTAYDLDNWGNVDRYSFNAKVTQQDLADTYQPPFQKCIQKGRASGIMCSYNSVNGVPSCTNYGLLTKTARADWGFNGYIVSDCTAVNVITSGHHFAKNREDAVADVFKAGMDIECGSQTLSSAKPALAHGKLSVADINRALHNLFSIRMRLGLFDGNPFIPYGSITARHVCTQEHQSLALSAAQQGIVLLKNEKNHLPISRTTTRTLAVIGPNADNPRSLLSNYHGPPCNLITPLRGLQGYLRDVRFVQGCHTTACSSPSISQAVEIAKLADQVVLFMGLDTTLEQEMTDRVSLLLPGNQQVLISSVARAAKNPVTLVLISGGSLDVTFAKKDPKIGSILWAGYPGEAGGRALADVIFGVHNPGGRLPVTWYPQGFVKVPMTDMRMRADGKGYPGRTYRFYKGPAAVFPFAHGLSYTNYHYEFVSVSQTKITINQNRTIASTGLYDTSLMGEQICESLKFSAVVGVKNDGKMAGRHPVLLFIRGSTARDDAPIKELVGFKSVHLDSNEAAQLKFEVRPCEHLSRSLEDGSRVMEAGTHFLMVGEVETQVSVAGVL